MLVLNKKPPNILIKKKDKGGITISHTVPLTKLEPEEIRAVLAEYKHANCDVAFRCDATLDELIDVIEGNRVYLPCLYVLNKIDAISIEELDLLYRIPNSVPILGQAVAQYRRAHRGHVGEARHGPCLHETSGKDPRLKANRGLKRICKCIEAGVCIRKHL